MGEQFKEKNSPTLSCELAIGIFCGVSFLFPAADFVVALVAVSPFSGRSLVGSPPKPVKRSKIQGHPPLTPRAGLME